MVDDDDGVEIEEVDVRNRNDEKSEKKSNKEDALPSKNEEPKVDIKTLPFSSKVHKAELR